MKNFKIRKIILIIVIISAVVFESQADRRRVNNRPRPPVPIEPEINDNPNDIQIDHYSLLTEPNSKILRSDNQTREEIIQEQNQQNLENGEHFEGDIVLLPEQQELLNSNDDSPMETGLSWEQYRWPRARNGKPTVPYEISSVYCESHSMLSPFDELHYLYCSYTSSQQHQVGNERHHAKHMRQVRSQNPRAKLCVH
jgi:hypothetical protein